MFTASRRQERLEQLRERLAPAATDRLNEIVRGLGDFEKAETPIPNYSLAGIPAAAQLMMAKVLMQEMKDSPIRINEVLINGTVNTRISAEKARPQWITADEVGDYVAWLVSDKAHMVRSSVPYLEEQVR